MNMNLVVVAGKLAAPPELREFESGSSLLRSLITVRSDAPRRRVDVLPVTLWDPAGDHELIDAPVGKGVWVVGSVQRRFWSATEGRRSRLEIVAHHMELRSDETVATTNGDEPVTAMGRG
jgi:single-stranded DNA-binding protein